MNAPASFTQVSKPPNAATAFISDQWRTIEIAAAKRELLEADCLTLQGRKLASGLGRDVSFVQPLTQAAWRTRPPTRTGRRAPRPGRRSGPDL
jgi:hypothetical protein